MSFDRREARIEILELFDEAQHLGTRQLRVSHTEMSSVRFFTRATKSRILELGICLACGSRAPEHACPLETPPPTFLQLFKALPTQRPRRPRSRVLLRQFPPHEKGYRCHACGSGSNAHLCPG